MPTYKVTDPDSGRTLRLTGDSPPTEDELNEIFGSQGAVSETPQSESIAAPKLSDPGGQAAFSVASEALALPVSGIAGIAGTIAGLVPGGESPSEKGNRFLETARDFVTVGPSDPAAVSAIEKVGGVVDAATRAARSPVAAAGNFSPVEDFRAAQPSSDQVQGQQAGFRDVVERGVGPVLGEKTFEATGSPGLAAAAETLPAAAAAAISTRVGVRPLGSRAQIARNAQEKFGLKVDPIAAETGGLSSVAEGVGGQAGVQRALAAQNQPKIRQAVASELGLPGDAPITRAQLGQVRKQAGQSSQALKQHGNLATDTTFRRDISNAVRELEQLRKESPSLSKGDSKVLKAAKELNRNELKYSVAVVQVRRIRELARQAYKKSPERGRAFSNLAKSLEDMMDRDLLRRGLPDDVARLRADRQVIAKAHTVEDALKGVDIDASSFAKALQRQEPLTGVLEELGDFATEFPDLVKVSKRGNPPASVTDALTGFGRVGLRAVAEKSSVPANAGPRVDLSPGATALLPFLDNETNNR